MESPGFSLGCRRISGSFRTRNDFVARCYGKAPLACQAITGLGTAQGSQARARRGSVSLFQGRHRAPHSARNLHKNTQFLSKPGKRAANLRRIIGVWQKSSASVSDRGLPPLAERLAAENRNRGQAV
jgi:hypothetical protein